MSKQRHISTAITFTCKSYRKFTLQYSKKSSYWTCLTTSYKRTTEWLPLCNSPKS